MRRVTPGSLASSEAMGSNKGKGKGKGGKGRKRRLTAEEEAFAESLAAARDAVRQMSDEAVGDGGVGAVHREDQLEGRIIDVLKGLRGYACEGVMVTRSGVGDRWKVVAFGGGEPTLAEQVSLMMRCLAAGLVAMDKVEDVENLSLDGD